jgi:hypothetical protein
MFQFVQFTGQPSFYRSQWGTAIMPSVRPQPLSASIVPRAEETLTLAQLSRKTAISGSFCWAGIIVVVGLVRKRAPASGNG